MDMKHIVWIVTSGIIAILLSVSVLIPVVESSAYTTVENGPSEGMTYSEYSSDVNKTMIFSSDRSAETYKMEIFTQPGNVKTVIEGNLSPMIIVASDYLMVYLDGDLNLVCLYCSLYDSLNTLTPRVYSVTGFTLSIRDGSATLTPDGSSSVSLPGAVQEFAYLPTVGGEFGSYNHGGINLIGNDPILGGVLVGDVGLYYNGERSFGTYGVATATANIDRTENRLNSISWSIPTESTTPIEQIDRDDIVSIGNEVSTLDVTQDPNDTQGIISNVWNVTLFDDNTCRINKLKTYRSSDPIFNSYLTVNGTNYAIKILGNGTEPLFSANQFSSFSSCGASIVNDNAFKNTGVMSFAGTSDLKVIGDNAFEGCPSVDLSYDSQYLVWIGDNAFKGTSFMSIYYDKVNHIGDSAFEGCTSLSSLSYYSNYDGIYSIGNNAFKGCTNFNADSFFAYVDDQRVAIIGDSAFEGCTNLISGFMSLGGTITEIGDRAFAGIGYGDSVSNYSSATFGQNVFADSTITTVNNLGGSTINQSNIGSGITLNNGYVASQYLGIISGSIQKEGLVYDLIVLIPLFVVIGMVVGIAIESYRFRT